MFATRAKQMTNKEVLDMTSRPYRTGCGIKLELYLAVLEEKNSRKLKVDSVYPDLRRPIKTN